MCEVDQAYDGPNGMYVVRDGSLWVDIPKCGSVSIKRKHKFGGGSSKLRCISDMSKFKEGFVVLRDPIDRFKSLVAMYFLDGSYQGHGRAMLGHHSPSTIVEVVLRRFAEIEHIPDAFHWFTQKSFIPEVFFELRDPSFYDMEWLRENYEVSNTTNSSAVQVSEGQREEILKIYAEDVELYERYIIRSTSWAQVSIDHEYDPSY